MARALPVAALVVVCAFGCKGKEPPRPTTGSSGSGSGSATPTDAAPIIDWTACETALKVASEAPSAARAKIIIDGCQVCGDWSPILSWNTPTTKGGPAREQIEASMVRCNAFCTGDAKLKFMGTLDDARGSTSRTPWRQLAAICKDSVSAGSEQRYMSAPYFALDRIARAVAARGGVVASLASAIPIPLPPVTVVGTAPELPIAQEVSADAGPVHVSVLGSSFHMGYLPRVRMGGDGLDLEAISPPYPGLPVPNEALRDTLVLFDEGDSLTSILLIAPRESPARGVIAVVKAAAGVAPVYLATQLDDSPIGWQLTGALRVALELGTDDPITITNTLTVQQLADQIAERARKNAVRASLAVD